MPNSQNEKLVALNLERIQYWLAQGAGLSDPVAQVYSLLYSYRTVNSLTFIY